METKALIVKNDEPLKFYKNQILIKNIKLNEYSPKTY